MNRTGLAKIVTGTFGVFALSAFERGTEQQLSQAANSTAVARLIQQMSALGTPEQQFWRIVDTGQSQCYDADGLPGCLPGVPRQDAMHTGWQPSYAVSADRLTVYDNQTRLTWKRSYARDPLHAGKFRFSHDQALAHVRWLNEQHFAGRSDWRLPLIKELYSLIEFGDEAALGFRGQRRPYIDQDVFEFRWGDPEGTGIETHDSSAPSTRMLLGFRSRWVIPRKCAV